MEKRSDAAFPMLGLVWEIVAIPYNFFAGFVTGLVAPLAAIAAIVAGVRLTTGKMPFLSLVEKEEDGERRLSLSLVPEEEVSDRFAAEKEKVSSDIEKLRAEVQSLMQEGKAAQESSEEITSDAE